MGHSAAIYDACLHDSKIYTASGDKYVARWLLDPFEQDRFAVKAEDSIYAVQVVRNGTALMFGTSKGSLHVIDLLAKQEIKNYEQHKKALFRIVENVNKQEIYSSDADGNLAVWNSADFSLKLFLPFDCGKIRAIHYDEAFLYLGTQEGEVIQLNIRNFSEVNRWFVHEGGVNVIRVMPNRKDHYISGGKDGHWCIWKGSGEIILRIPAHHYAIYDLTFLNNQTLFATASRDKSIKIWDVSTLEVVQKLERKHGGHSHSINTLVKTSEAQFYSLGDDKRMIAWNLEP